MVKDHHNQPNAAWTKAEIAQRVSQLGEWFHNLNLSGIQTAPHHFLGDFPEIKWRRFQHVIPANLADKTVLDIGCNAGFYSLEMKRRGARKVIGIDSDPLYLAQARFAAEVCGLDIEFRELSVYDVGELHERFDLVLFLGVFYHLRYPLLALDLIREHVFRDRLIFQSMLRGTTDVAEVRDDYDFWDRSLFELDGAPKLHFIENRYSGDPTNWWIPNRACVEAMLRTSGFEVLDCPEEEVYLCGSRKRRGLSFS